MKKGILELLKQEQTIFSVKELANFIEHKSEAYLRNRISFLVKKGILKKVYRGFYTTKDEINKFELANKIYSPSYISFFSALYHHKIIFQYQNEVYLAYKKSDTVVLDEFSIVLKNLKESLLLNLEGIEIKKDFSIASKERAFLDTLYIYGDTYFDNLSLIDFKKVKKLVKIYNSKKLEKLLEKYL